MTFNDQPARVIPWNVAADDRTYQGFRVLAKSGDKEIDVTALLTPEQTWEAFIELQAMRRGGDE
jgi:hypothetical protein